MTAPYDTTLKEKLERELNIAIQARKEGLDPAPAPEINITKDLAERVEALIGIKGLSARIRELEREGLGREEIALKIGYDFVEGKFGGYKDKKIEILENAVRTAVAILTEGVVAAPIDGISRLEAGINDDSSEYIKIFYAGPIRSAGGTAQALSVLAADTIRRRMGFAAYQPREEEIGRYVLEVSVYAQLSGLQYTPSDEEIKEIVRNCPICIDGDATEDREVGGYKDLKRVATNKIRGGMVLVLTEGIAMKAPKIKRHVDRLELDGWGWLAKLVKSKGEKRKKDFLADLIAGRPVFGRPSAKGSFRLRYGRARNSGLAAVGLNPDTMQLLGFTAAGTQIKPELPGKAGCVVPVDSIEGPTVKLNNGDLVRLNAHTQEKMQVRPASGDKCEGEVAEIVDLGEMLIDYGDFLETGHRLMPGAYSHEWWLKDLEAVSGDEADKWRLKTPNQTEALELASRFAIPLHPAYTYLWEDVTEADREYLAACICEKGILEAKTLSIPADESGRINAILDGLLVLHHVQEKMQAASGDRNVLLVIEEAGALLRCLGINAGLRRDESVRIKTRNKAPTRIGVRMGRPEKSKERRMTPAPHSIFPVGEYGGKNRSLKEAVKEKVIEVEIGTRRCRKCGNEFLSSFSLCDKCGASDFQTQDKMQDARYRMQVKQASRDGRSVDLWDYYQRTIKKVGALPDKLDVKCVQGLISEQKVAEHLGKGILRAKHGLVVFKDGTIRYDFTNLPLTHFKPAEIALSVEKAKELGYSHDINGEELKSETQIVELKQQDVIISDDALSHLLKVSQFLDSLLSQFYDLPPYYETSNREDLIGELVLGLAPHTSAGILGRIIGFTRASACYAHPFFHAAKRRNCLSPNTEVPVLNSGRPKRVELESLYRREKSPEVLVDDFGTTRKTVAGLKTYALNPENGTFAVKDIKSVIKTPAPRHLLHVRTKSGRAFVSSPEHRTVVWNSAEGGIDYKKCVELKKEDKLLVPEHLEFQRYAHDGEKQDLLEENSIFDRRSGDAKEHRPRVTKFGEVILDEVKGIEPIRSECAFLYDIEVSTYHNFLVNNFVLSANCDGDEDSIILLLDALLNFSLFFLPEKKGGRMDAPLVLIPFINPKEVDKEAHNVSTASEYPREFYEAACMGKNPKEVEIETAASRIEAPKDIYGFRYTHETTDIAAGPLNSLYKTLGTMVEKLDAQLQLARMIRAVDECEVAETVIKNHFLRDIKGNLRAFGSQTMRCSKCNAKYRRIPLSGTCNRCGSKLLPSVHVASIKKYLEVSLRVAKEYHVSDYTRQRLELLEHDVNLLFPAAAEKQKALSDFM
jgi:DNA polymerase II large subunit